MKVVLISNFNEESVSESVFQEDLNEADALAFAKEWNDSNCNEYSIYHAVVKPDDYRLWRGIEDLI